MMGTQCSLGPSWAEHSPTTSRHSYRRCRPRLRRKPRHVRRRRRDLPHKRAQPQNQRVAPPDTSPQPLAEDLSEQARFNPSAAAEKQSRVRRSRVQASHPYRRDRFAALTLRERRLEDALDALVAAALAGGEGTTRPLRQREESACSDASNLQLRMMESSRTQRKSSDRFQRSESALRRAQTRRAYPEGARHRRARSVERHPVTLLSENQPRTRPS
jgi:hypothetical protein